MFEPDLSATGNVVVRLSRVIPRNKHHKLYFDTYYNADTRDSVFSKIRNTHCKDV